MVNSVLKKVTLLGFITIAVIGGLSYFFNESQAVADVSAKSPAQAVPVTVETIAMQSIQIWNQYTARLESIGYAEIKPQVTGRITEIRFHDGQIVNKGDIIYVVDPRVYEASLEQSKAELDVARNNALLARKEYNRAKELIATKVISQTILDERLNALNIAESLVKRWSAAVEEAKINVDYAYIKAPISGKISRAEIKVGNVVQAGSNAPLLTSIVTIGGIYADFEVDEKTYFSIAQGELEGIPVQLTVGNQSQTYQGIVDSFDNRINPATGTIRARALFKNTTEALLPGMLATIKMGQSRAAEVISIPEIALGTDQNRKFVYVVNDENIVTYRAVTVGSKTNGRLIIKSGLNVGDKVITEGLIKIRPDMVVAPQVKKQEV